MTTAEILWLRDDGATVDTAPLSNAERQEMASHSSHERRRGFLLTRLLLRRLLAAHLPADAIHFTRAASGRLLLAGNSHWHISLSHCDDAVAVIASTRPCGIDIEKPRAIAFERIAARYFSESENTALKATPENERASLFTCLWTLKEASVKALREGLANNLSRLSFDTRAEPPRLTTPDISLQLWQNHAPPHWIAAAVTGTEPVRWNVREIKTGMF